MYIEKIPRYLDYDRDVGYYEYDTHLRARRSYELSELMNYFPALLSSILSGRFS